MYYLMIVIAVVLLALQFSTNRAYGLKCGSTAKASMIFTVLSGIAAAVICAVIALITEGSLSFPPYSILMAAIVSVLCCTYNFIGFKIMEYGSLSVYMMFLMLGGMMLPYLFGVFFLDEKVSVCRILGFILLIVSMAFPVLARGKSSEEKEGSGKSSSANVIFFLLCAAVFCLNGGVSITSKIHQTSSLTTCGSAAFSVLTNSFSVIIGAVWLAILALTDKKDGADGKSKFPTAKEIFSQINPGVLALLVIGRAAFGGISYVLQLFSASHVDASMLYPMITGGSVVLSALAGLIFFGEKPDKLSAVGLLLSFAATFLFLF